MVICPLEGRIINFYPRSPRGERLWDSGHRVYVADFYPRSPRGERRSGVGYWYSPSLISIHAPREGSDRRQGRPSFW